MGGLDSGGGGGVEGGWWGEPVGTPYSPHTLDGWLGAGNHSTYLPFSSYLVSPFPPLLPVHTSDQNINLLRIKQGRRRNRTLENYRRSLEETVFSSLYNHWHCGEWIHFVVSTGLMLTSRGAM